MLDGQQYYFLSFVSEVLDEYEPEFRLWLVAPEVRERESAWWARWVEWRSSSDRCEQPLPIESDAAFLDLETSLQESRTPPASVILGAPESKLDPDHSYADRVPRHEVRWHLTSGSEQPGPPTLGCERPQAAAP